MSQDDTDPLLRLAALIDILGGHDDVQEGVYLDACNALKELHSLSKLYKVTYYEFVVELGDHGPVVSSKLRTRILSRDDDDANTNHPTDVLDLVHFVRSTNAAGSEPRAAAPPPAA